VKRRESLEVEVQRLTQANAALVEQTATAVNRMQSEIDRTDLLHRRLARAIEPIEPRWHLMPAGGWTARYVNADGIPVVCSAPLTMQREGRQQLWDALPALSADQRVYVLTHDASHLERIEQDDDIF